MGAHPASYTPNPEVYEREKAAKRERYRTDPQYRLRIINAARQRYGAKPHVAVANARLIAPFENAPREPKSFEAKIGDRFWAKVEKRGPDDCWFWRGDTNHHGYGKISIRRRPTRATHIALLLDGRPRPGAAHALHSCDRPNCVNPRHLRWGTHRENMDDRIARRGK